MKNLKGDYVSFGIIEDMEGFPLVLEEDRTVWGLVGGKVESVDGGCPHNTLMREAEEEVNIIILDPEREVFEADKGNHDLVVWVAKYYNGELRAKGEIKETTLFSRKEIEKMICTNMMLPYHACALIVYFFSRKKIEGMIARGGVILTYHEKLLKEYFSLLDSRKV